MRRLYIGLVILVLLSLIPTGLQLCGRFDNYEVCPWSTRFGDTFPPGTFVLKEAAGQELCRMFRIIHTIFQDLQIPYSLSSGTLLGWTRHNKNIIPFDDDIDLYIFDPLPVDQIRARLPPHLSLIWFQGWWKFVSKKIGLFDRLAIAVDLFEFETVQQNNRTLLRLKDPYARKSWPKEVFPYDDFFPLQKDTFCGHPAFVPAHPAAVLTQQYGPDWNTIAYVNNVHGPFAYVATHCSLRGPPTTKLTLTPAQRVGLVRPSNVPIQDPCKEDPDQVDVKEPWQRRSQPQRSQDHQRQYQQRPSRTPPTKKHWAPREVQA